jgi:dihydroflavonol-4-reductase
VRTRPVLVTGGTGFIGAYTAAALVEAGHEVRLLVRDPKRIETTVGRLGAGPMGHAVGDITDAASVEAALDGCDAVVHCAAAVSTERHRAAETLRTNTLAAENVLGTAVKMGLDPVIHVSSVTALFRPGLPALHAELPVADADTAYGRSKAAADLYARSLQEQGAPVVITYPGAVMGPPAGTSFGEANDSMAGFLRFGVAPIKQGGLSVIDVRDCAAIHVAACVPGRGPRRYVCGGHLLWIPEFGSVVAEITGKRFVVLPLPGVVLRAAGRVVDAAVRFVPIPVGLTHESSVYLTQWVPTDDQPVFDELGITYRDVKETIADTLRGMVGAGLLPAKAAGRLMDGRSAGPSS